ncbi:MAG TPA: hypothetical protein VF034_04935 [Gemmatimonadaceae bacterium]
MAALSLTGCSALMRASRTPTQPPAAEAWAQASAMAASQVGAGSYAAADRALSDFAARYPHTPQALSATLRRAVYMADPANQMATVREATALLDSTLAQPLDSASRSDARTLRRITSALQRAASLSAGGAANVSTPDSSARAVDSRSNSEEIQRLRNELAKANAELERIKKRVAQPKP